MHPTWNLFGKSATWTVPKAVVARAPRPQPTDSVVEPTPVRCRQCDGELSVILDLGNQPFFDRTAPDAPRRRWPLQLARCSRCDLVQLANRAETEACESTYLRPDRADAEAEALIKGLRLTAGSLVIELASGDGAALTPFRNRGIRVLGMEPSHDLASIANDAGVPTRACAFDIFSARKLAKEGLSADLLVTRDLVARTPRLEAFAEAARRVLKTNGVLLLEVPHLLKIVQETRFDIIRHTHLSYFSLIALERLLTAHGLRLVHAAPARQTGWLRVYACRIESALVESETVGKMLAREKAASLDCAETVTQFGERARTVIERVQNFIQDLRKDGKTIVAYGASAECDILLGYCGAHAGLIAYIADPDRTKQGTTLPATAIPVVSPDRIRVSRPDFLLVLPGCSLEDAVRRHRYIQNWGGRFGCLALK